ncbi:hypothetical protein HY450_03340 [Candidatus Pacearchaeota archaeon]|nr:hypothetical protein [Candidatus Pacearchaeota archaeon]
MVLVKILGGIDLGSAIVLLMITFGFGVPSLYLIFFSLLLFVKSLFVFSKDLLSLLDFFASMTLLFEIFFAVPIFLVWSFSFLLLAKGIVSFL